MLEDIPKENVVVDIEISQLPSNLEATIQPATAEATISKKVF